MLGGLRSEWAREGCIGRQLGRGRWAERGCEWEVAARRDGGLQALSAQVPPRHGIGPARGSQLGTQRSNSLVCGNSIKGQVSKGAGDLE